MHRAGIEPVRSLVTLCALLLGGLLLGGGGRAWAFHAGATFDQLPGQGGAGGIFYTGLPSERRWNCTACHINSDGQIRVGLSTSPAGLFENGRYTPGQAYVVTVKLVGEHRGQSSSRSNFNGFNVAFADGNNKGAGKISGYDPNDYYAPNGTTLATSGKVVGTTSWTFTWTAPMAGSGPVTMYLGMVDGNGANSPPTQTLTDPFGDDVVVVQVVLKDGSMAALSRPPAPCDLLAEWRRQLALVSAQRRRRG